MTKLQVGLESLKQRYQQTYGFFFAAHVSLFETFFTQLAVHLLQPLAPFLEQQAPALWSRISAPYASALRATAPRARLSEMLMSTRASIIRVMLDLVLRYRNVSYVPGDARCLVSTFSTIALQARSAAAASPSGGAAGAAGSPFTLTSAEAGFSDSSLGQTRFDLSALSAQVTRLL